MKTEFLEKIKINNSQQWILIRGKNAEAPLIIQVQAGPGFPMISEADSMNKLLKWEDDYLVVYWDQRGCGKSFNKQTNPESITLEQLTEDLIDCTQYLLKKYHKKKAILIGYSIGATISLMAASKAGELYSNIFLVGIDIDIPYANRYAIDFAKKKAREKGKTNLVKHLNHTDYTSVKTSDVFQERAKIISNMGGIMIKKRYVHILLKTLTNILFCKHYKLTDIFRTLQGMEFCQKALLPEMDSLNLFKKQLNIIVPVHFIQGLHDGVASFETSVKYFELLQAKPKTFETFENSAHMPHLEEPEKFYRLIKEKSLL
ncbi:alpha/beta fold hydrolase [Sporocytophaga myxococcoides]|uniref:alpha/beta fold hydrolase n=1 Tax=Sporocytophaga myxococcoides TaxID=153721 RepID=UPI0004237F78|nr:alpha/beta hydrolase [Sporocytophaga myxococcoides]